MDYTTWVTLLGSLAFAGAAGLLSPFVTLKRESFTGDIIAHASLAGVFFMLTLPLQHSNVTVFIGGLVAAVLAHVLIHFLEHQTNLSKDLILAFTLSLFIGLALILLTALLALLGESTTQSGERIASLLRRYLFGSPASLHLSEAFVLVGTALFTCVMLWGFYKIWVVFAWNGEWGSSTGFSPLRAEWTFKSVFIIVVMVGILAVGALMVTALLVAPGITARTWTTRLHHLIFISTFISLSTMALTLFLGTQISGLPEGPLVIFLNSSLAILALLSYPLRKHLLKSSS